MPLENSFKSKNGIKFVVKRSIRRTLGISINNQGTVIVLAPTKLPHSIIEQTVDSKTYWITRKQHEISKKTKLAKIQFDDATDHLYLGEHKKLYVIKNDEEKVEVSTHLQVFTRAPENEFKVKHILEMWYLKQASLVFRERLDELFKLLLPYTTKFPMLNIVKMRGKWGQCSTKNAIILNPNLIKTPIECIDYVIVHELCHLLEMNHSSRFYSLMTRFMPDWKRRKRLLNTFM